MVWHPVGSYHCPPIHCCLWKWPRRRIYENSLTLPVIHNICKSASQAILSLSTLVGCSSPFMRLVEHLTALRGWCYNIAMSAWSVKTRRAPSRHCRDARVYDHTTTAMHDVEYTLPPPPPTSSIHAMFV